MSDLPCEQSGYERSHGIGIDTILRRLVLARSVGLRWLQNGFNDIAVVCLASFSWHPEIEAF